MACVTKKQRVLPSTPRLADAMIVATPELDPWPRETSNTPVPIPGKLMLAPTKDLAMPFLVDLLDSVGHIQPARAGQRLRALAAADGEPSEAGDVVEKKLTACARSISLLPQPSGFEGLLPVRRPAGFPIRSSRARPYVALVAVP